MADLDAEYTKLYAKLVAVKTEPGNLDIESSIRLTKFEVHLLGSLMAEEMQARGLR